MVKFSLSTPSGHTRRARGIYPLIINLSTRWQRVVNFTPWPLYPWERILVPTGLASSLCIRLRQSRTEFKFKGNKAGKLSCKALIEIANTKEEEVY
jgi:hypothetical protein